MSRVFPIDTPAERDDAERLWHQLTDATDNVPGWMVEQSKVLPVLDRLERALDAYDRRYGEGDE